MDVLSQLLEMIGRLGYRGPASAGPAPSGAPLPAQNPALQEQQQFLAGLPAQLQSAGLMPPPQGQSSIQELLRLLRPQAVPAPPLGMPQVQSTWPTRPQLAPGGYQQLMPVSEMSAQARAFMETLGKPLPGTPRSVDEIQSVGILPDGSWIDQQGRRRQDPTWGRR